jgi:ergot alkaloid biosynthesis protein
MFKNILVTGGTGKTGRHVVEQLHAKGISPRIATRNPMTTDAVRFQWQDPTSFEDAFLGIEAVYLVAPTDTFDSIGAMQPALEHARKAGVVRFVLLSASSLDEGGPMMGAVHAWLRVNAPECAVLRPSWFMQNFSEGQHLAPIRDDSAIYSATQDGRVGFIDAEDIANCASTLLIAQEIENTDHILTGPEELSYDDVAKVFSRELDRNISHKRLTVDGIASRFTDLGFPLDYATTLATMDETIASGSEARTTDNVRSITGRKPNTIEAFIHRHHEVWAPKN